MAKCVLNKCNKAGVIQLYAEDWISIGHRVKVKTGYSLAKQKCIYNKSLIQGDYRTKSKLQSEFQWRPCQWSIDCSISPTVYIKA